jgi:hypothetical protein
MRSLLGVSAFGGTSGQGIHKLTWDNTGDFYVRVRGQNGAFNLASPFHLDVTELTGSCANVQPITTSGSLSLPSAGFKTIVLTDYSRLEGTAADKTTLQTRLATYVARPEVAGRVLDISSDARVAVANAQADAHRDCPFAKNQVAQAVKAIIDRARQAGNPLQYVVLVGDDAVIPYFRHPDQAGLGDETGYEPPVEDASASQASLRLGYVLSQDDYGSSTELSRSDHTFPLPGMAVGRLVETATDATGMLDAYLSTLGGVVATPHSALVTGYDFFAGAASSTNTDSIQTELAAGLGVGFGGVDSLVSPPLSTWTADDLRAQLLGKRHDLIFLGAHFSAVSALAADYQTRVLASEVANSNVDLRNAIVFSLGCHSGYNIVAGDAIPNVTLAPDFPRAFASKQATLIAGTGYQYGDTDFIAYDERLYLEFSRQLRTGSGPVSVGKALMAAKQAYLASTAVPRGIDEKSLLEATLFGLPQLSVTEPGARLSPPTDTSIVTATLPYTTNPGSTLGLVRAVGSEPTHHDVRITPNLTSHTVALTDVTTGKLVTPAATYWSGSNDVLSEEAAPVLPLEIRNVSVPGTVLRGVGFRGSSYQDTPNVRPLTGAPATELRSVHAPFQPNVLFPIRPWSVNYYDALVGGATRLMVTPAQYISSGPGLDTDTLRQSSSLDFRLFYSNNTQSYGSNRPGLDASPAISQISAVPTPDGRNVGFAIDVTGDPAAGVQEVWVTYTSVNVNDPLYGTWQSLDLSRVPPPYTTSNPSMRWTGTLPLPVGQLARDVRFMVQAVNGVGLVSLVTNLGAYYTPAPYFVQPQVQLPPTAPKQATTLVFAPQPRASGTYRESVDVSAVLTSNNQPLGGRTVSFGIGTEVRRAVTDATGLATATLPLLQTPQDDTLRVVFDESNDFLGSADSTPFSITKQATTLALSPGSFSGAYPGPLPFEATLSDASPEHRVLREQSVFFVLSGAGQTYATTSITDFAGRAALPSVPLPIGTYTLKAYFGGTIALGNGHTVTQANDRFLPSSSTSATLTLTARDARPTYTGALVASPPCRTCDTAIVTASATIQDASLLGGASGSNTSGTTADVRNATVAFVDRATGRSLCSAPVGLVNPSDTRLGTAACTWSASLATQNSITYTVGIVVSGSYAHDSPDQNVQVTVSRAALIHLNGEGTLALVHAAGQLLPNTAKLARFTVDAGPPGDNSFSADDARAAGEGRNDQPEHSLPGRLELTFQIPGHTYRLISTTLTSLAAPPGTASNSSTASAATVMATLHGSVRIEDVTDPEHVQVLDSSALLQVTASETPQANATNEDADDPQRSTGAFGITAWRSSGGLWFASEWDGLKTAPQTLASGHLHIDLH